MFRNRLISLMFSVVDVSCKFVCVDESHFFCFAGVLAWGGPYPLLGNPIILISEVPAFSSHVCLIRLSVGAC